MNIELTRHEAKLIIEAINIALCLDRNHLYSNKDILLGIASKLYKECRDTREPLSCIEFVNKITNGDVK